MSKFILAIATFLSIQTLSAQGFNSWATYIDAAETCTSTSFVQCTASADSVTFTLADTTNVVIEYTATASTNIINQVIRNLANIDGTNVTVHNNAIVFSTALDIKSSIFTYRTSLPAGQHTVTIYHAISNNSGGNNVLLQSRTTKVTATNP